MAYLTTDQIRSMGFLRFGRNVKISDKASIYDCASIAIGDNSRIDDFCVISGRIEIGRNVHITPMCLVAGGTKGITFEDFSTLAYNVKIFTQSDDYSGATMTNSTVPARFKHEIRESVHVGRHVIIGTGAIIMPGVCLAEGCSVGAMSLVRKSTEPWGVYAGVPARRLKERKRDLLQLEADYLKEGPLDSV